MRISEDTPDRLVLGMTPWGPWILSVVAGAAFLAFAALDPTGEMPPWARAVAAFLGAVAPVAFLASHAAVRAEFDRRQGVLRLVHTRPLGGASETRLGLDRIAAIEYVTETDADNDTHHRIELLIRGPQAGRLALTTAPISTDQSRAALRIAAWLGLPAPLHRAR